jgi:hypothetical protein
LAQQWFRQSKNAYKTWLAQGDALPWCAFRAFVSLQVAQVAFGRQTIDKRKLLALYEEYVPEFSLKDFGCWMIREKAEQRFPDHPPNFASADEYANFDAQLGELVQRKAEDATQRRASEQC